MIRCHLQADRWGEAFPELDEAESRHLVSVMRRAAGDAIEVLDGVGRLAAAEVVTPHKKHTVIRLGEVRTLERFRPRRILMQALVREKQMDWLIQKAVELGVHEIRPIQTDQSVVRIRPEDAERKAERWRSIALSACKQSGNPWLPEIHPVRTFAKALAAAPETPACFGALQENTEPLPVFFDRLRETGVDALSMWIGPEGDFSMGEVEALLEAGVQPVTFGPIVFRVETAALFILSALQYAWLKPE